MPISHSFRKSIFVAQFTRVTKTEKYQAFLTEAEALLNGETNLVSSMANISALLKQHFKFFWVGFYTVEGEELQLGPFQGPVACTRIARGKGVCGTAWEQTRTIVVPDVHKFPGHIACSEYSRSEIVVPVFDKNRNVLAVLDVDSERLNEFDDTDRHFLGELAELLSKQHG